MPTLKNTTTQDIRLYTGHLIPAKGERVVESGTLNHIDNLPRMGTQIRKGQLVVLDNVEPEYEKFSREHVAHMDRKELTDCLKAHDAKANGTTDELRQRLVDVMFVNYVSGDGEE